MVWPTLLHKWIYLGRIGIAGQSLGIWQAWLECAVKYSMEREAFGQPISKMFWVQDKLARYSVSVSSSYLTFVFYVV